MLFAAWDFSTITLFVFGLLALVAYGAAQLYLMIYRPDVFKQLQQNEHERRMAWQQRQREKEAARRARNGKAMDAAGGLLKLFLGRK